jgi:hypothetical protein
VTNNELISPSLNTKIVASVSHPTGVSNVQIFINGKLVENCNDPKNGTCDVFVKGSSTASGTHTIRVDATAKNSVTGTSSLTFRR